jgi:hypothetical protein
LKKKKRVSLLDELLCININTQYKRTDYDMHQRELSGTHNTRKSAVIKRLFFEDKIAIEIKASGNPIAV